ncbi:hypothetical protein ACFLXE_05330 [Chloroflexota bacterium]
MEVKVFAESWMKDYHQIRPHGGLDIVSRFLRHRTMTCDGSSGLNGDTMTGGVSLRIWPRLRGTLSVVGVAEDE